MHRNHKNVPGVRATLRIGTRTVTWSPPWQTEGVFNSGARGRTAYLLLSFNQDGGVGLRNHFVECGCWGTPDQRAAFFDLIAEGLCRLDETLERQNLRNPETFQTLWRRARRYQDERFFDIVAQACLTAGSKTEKKNETEHQSVSLVP